MPQRIVLVSAAVVLLAAAATAAASSAGTSHARQWSSPPARERIASPPPLEVNGPLSAAVSAIPVHAAVAPKPLLPDLKQRPPYQISISTSDPYHPGRQELIFASAVDNLGAGPLIIEGSKQSSDPAVDMTASQVVRLSDGTTRTYPGVGTIYFDYGHYHWHLRGFDHYELRARRGYRLVAPDHKSGFCLGDRYKAVTDYALPGQPSDADPSITGDCASGRLDITSIEEGISVGWGDDYVPQLEGQYVDITSLPAGDYYLVHRVDVGGPLKEIDRANDAASVLLHIARNGAPRVKVLATCDETDRCEPSLRPRLRSKPHVRGARVGVPARCGPGRWSGHPTRFYYQWFRGGYTRPGATSAVYRPTREDAGRQLKCRVVSVNAEDDSTAWSNAVTVAR